MFTAALLSFFASAFLGWLLESFWLWFHLEHSIKGVLYPLPLKPIYGFGGMLIVLAGPYITQLHLSIQWLILAVALGGFEALGGLWTEKVYKRKLWRYKGTFLNVHGYTDAFHAAMWGMLGLVVLHLL